MGELGLACGVGGVALLTFSTFCLMVPNVDIVGDARYEV